MLVIGIAQRTGGDVSRVAVQRAEKLVDKIDYFIHKSNALSQLAEILAPPERSSAVTRALFLVLHFPNPMFRVSAIINLVPLLPTNLQKMAIERVLNNGSGDPFYALHLAHLAANVTTELLRQDVVKASLDKLQNPQMQFREEAFLELLQFVQDKGRYNALLDRVQTWIDGQRDAEKVLRFAELAKLADQRGDLCEVHRLGDCIDEAIDRLDNEDETSMVLADVVATLPERLRLHFVPKAYDKCKGAKASQKRAQNLAKLVPHLGGADRAKAIAISFDAAKAVEHPTRRLEVLGMVAPLLSGVERGEAVGLLLDLCAQLGRSQAHSLLRDLPSLLPEKDHAIVLLPAMAALDEMAEWFP